MSLRQLQTKHPHGLLPGIEIDAMKEDGRGFEPIQSNDSLTSRDP
jgi:hypothetical protein